MTNSTIPHTPDMPSNTSLLKATITAFVAAMFILISVVLPAEFGIDITGIGQTLGLKQMGEIKTALAQEAKQNELDQQINNTEANLLKPPARLNVDTVKQINNAQKVTDVAVVATIENNTPDKSIAPAIPSDKRVMVLANGAAAELKVALKKGKSVSFKWSATDKINFDNHGDSPSVKYHRYSKGRSVNQDQGTIIAAFDGYHGWFWRNRSGKSVTVEIQFEGEYSEVKRIK